MIFIDYDPASGTHVAEANTPADTRNSDNTVTILGQHLDNWHNIDVVPALTCERRKHIYTEALKRNDKKIFVERFIYITTYKSLNRLSISRHSDLLIVKST